MDSIFRKNESKDSTSLYPKNKFMGIQMNIEMMAPEKNSSQMIDMDISLLGVGRQVIKIRFHNVFDIMEGI